MAGKTSKWLFGCGAGCVFVLLVISALVYGGFRVAKHAVHEIRDFGDTYKSLGEGYGGITDYAPPADGSLSADRLETFLEIRSVMETRRLELAQTLATLSEGENEGVDSPGDVVRMFKSGAGMLPQIMRYVTQRTESQIENEMGQGEYIFIYVMSYYSWLDKSPGDGPDFQLMGDDRVAGRNMNFEFRGQKKRDEVRENRRKMIRKSVNRHVIAMLENQLATLELLELDRSEWAEALRDEIEKMDQHRNRIPWSDGLPVQLRVSLEPYRLALEDSYNPWCNPLEVGIGFR